VWIAIDREEQTMRRVIGGALAGLLATAPMTAVIYAGRRAGLLWNPPPRQITGRVLQRIRGRGRMPRPAFQASWLAAHFGYGSAAGVVYSLVRRLLPGRPVLAGLTFGEGVWAASYLGLMPEMRLYPCPQQDTGSRTAVMIAAHAVYGVALAELFTRLTGRRTRP